MTVRHAQRQRPVEVVLALPHQHGRGAAAAGLADGSSGSMEAGERRGLAASAAAVGAGGGDVERGVSAVAAGQLAAHRRRGRKKESPLDVLASRAEARFPGLDLGERVQHLEARE